MLRRQAHGIFGKHEVYVGDLGRFGKHLGSAPKSEATKERILEAGLALFGEKGYHAATMREISARADCSLGLAYRYYLSKDAMALALYERLLGDFAAAIDRLEPGALSVRWGAAMRADFARLAPHRPALIGPTYAGLAPGSPTQVLGPETRDLRLRMLNLFRSLAAGATDVPRTITAESLALALYGLHLLLVLFWLQDPTQEQLATKSLIGLCEDAMAWIRLLTRIPGFSASLQRLADILRPLLEGEPAA